MKRSAKEHRQEFEELGYTMFEGVLTQEEIDYALPIFDEIITIDTQPPVVTGTKTARRQLNSGLYCEPRLSAYGGKPAVLETVAILIDRPFRLTHSPIPVVTFPGKAGGVPGEVNWKGHVDWGGPAGPGEFWPLAINGVIHFTTVEPNGGGYTLVPGSPRIIQRYLNDPRIAQRMFRQDFGDVSGLSPEKEIRAKAGDVLYYHRFMVHGASDNQSSRARKVVAGAPYIPVLEGEVERKAREAIPGNFHPAHLAAMDEDFKRLITSGWS